MQTLASEVISMQNMWRHFAGPNPMGQTWQVARPINAGKLEFKGIPPMPLMTSLCSASTLATEVISMQNLWSHFVQLTLWRNL
jgi:hypothetical protein